MSNPEIYTVGWVCAIPTEFVAAQSFLDEKHPDPVLPHEDDSNSYALGSIGGHNVVIAVLPFGEYGTTNAATVARDMIRSFRNIRLGLMVGIGGGAPTLKQDIRLGDVVVSSCGNGKGGVYQYDFGKSIQDQAFQPTGFLNQPPVVLRTAVSKLIAQHDMEGQHLQKRVDAALDKISNRKKYTRPPHASDRLYRPDLVHSASANCCGEDGETDKSRLVHREERNEEDGSLIIHYGLIASGNQLMKDAIKRDKFSGEHGILCFEMEAAGLMNHFPCLVVRGICDYSDSHKNKQWQGFAAMAAAAYAKDLLGCITPRSVEKTESIMETLQSGRLPLAPNNMLIANDNQ